MKTVQRYPDTMTAHIARAILETEGVDSFVADENLANADPPVVFASGGIRLMVSEDLYDRAHEILNRSNEGAALPDDFDPGPPIDTENVPTPQATGPSMFGKVASAGLFMALGATIFYFYQKATMPSPLETTTVEEDMDDDGRTDRVATWQGSKLTRLTFDLDGNGSLETTIDYHDRGRATQNSDFNLDGEIDVVGFYEGVRYVRQDWLREGRVFKRVRFDGARITREELDLDGDGNFEVIRRYDAYSELLP